MGKIFCIIGKSSTGKDTIYQRLLDNSRLKLKNIVLYTTRPIRVNEKDGVEYHFCDAATRDAYLASGKVIEIRSYDTCHGIWDYFTVDDEQIQLDQQSYLMIGTLESYEKIKDYYNKGAVIPIYIEVEDGIRLERALRREMAQEHPKYEELCRRFLADSKDFSEEKLAEAKIDRIFHNDDIIKTEQEIVTYIQSFA